MLVIEYIRFAFKRTLNLVPKGTDCFIKAHQYIRPVQTLETISTGSQTVDTQPCLILKSVFFETELNTTLS